MVMVMVIIYESQESQKILQNYFKKLPRDFKVI